MEGNGSVQYIILLTYVILRKLAKKWDSFSLEFSLWTFNCSTCLHPDTLQMMEMALLLCWLWAKTRAVGRSKNRRGGGSSNVVGIICSLLIQNRINILTQIWRPPAPHPCSGGPENRKWLENTWINYIWKMRRCARS